jgi:hypothetical protein
MLDSFVEYDINPGWWFEMFLKIGEIVSKYPDMSAKNNNDFAEYLTYSYDRILKEYGEEYGENDTLKA